VSDASACGLASEVMAETDVILTPDQARACLRGSRELSETLGYHSAGDLIWATGIAFLAGDQAATLEFGRRAIRRLG